MGDSGWFVFAVLSALLTAFAAITEKRALRDTHSIDFAVALSAVVALASVGVLALQSFPPVPLKLLAGLVPMTGGAALAYFFATRAIRHLPISVSSPLLLLSPLFTTALAYLLLGEHLSYLQGAGVAALMAGLYVFETRHLRAWREFYDGLASGYARFALLAVALYGFTSLFDRVALGWWHTPPLQYVALAQIGIAFWMLVVARIGARRRLRDVFSSLGSSWSLILLVALLSFAYRVLQSHAAAEAPIGMVTAVKHSSAFFAVVIGGTLFHEEGLLRKALGSAIMIAGLALVALA